MALIDRNAALNWLWAEKSQTSGSGALIRAPLTFLGAAYSLAMKARARAYAQGLLKTRSLSEGSLPRPAKVIAVGNLTLGGTGKTPLVAEIAEWLLQNGHKPAVLCRFGGYDISYDNSIVVSDRDKNMVPKQGAGDEPVWLARNLPGVPVLLGTNRYRAGLRAIEEFGSTHLVLDDAFQHLPLKRDVNVLVVNSRYDLADEYVFPRGRLREPLSACARADLVVLSKAVSGEIPRPAWLDRYLPRARSFAMDYRLTRFYDIDRKEDEPQFPPPPVLAFCGVADPDYFFELLERNRIKVLDRVVFPDHHKYTEKDIKYLLARGQRAGARHLITTEKDAVKLAHLPDHDHIYVLGATLEWFEKREEFFGELLRLLERNNRDK